MKVLLVGSGAREHALAWKLSQSKVVTELLFWPGSAAINRLGKAFQAEDETWQGLAKAAASEKIDFVVVGPEQPLAEGFADLCRQEKIPVFGPQQRAAALESSKEFAKETMKAAGIPTAGYQVVGDFDECEAVALNMLARTGGAVIKASGLAAGKGVFVCQSEDDVRNGIHRLKTSMAQAAERIVVEEVLKGRECSFFCFVGEQGANPLGFAVDFKRLKDGDEGPNTGGMGCYTPVPWLPEDASEQVMSKVVQPLIAELKQQDVEYSGCLYVGLMWGEAGPSVVEFNVRLGDPEAQALAIHDSRDWGQMIASQLGLLERYEPQMEQVARQTVAIVMASEGYPYEKPKQEVQALPSDLFSHKGIDQAVFGASVQADGEVLKPGAGRVLTVVQAGSTFKKARSQAYHEVRTLAEQWPYAQFRNDIALRVADDS
ncbi:phosphoribosylamine--glycine ligase [Pseudobacteriovorax antillogorgiicola]|uniref:phosphoribosylamine--glycine ligase n=1 Tax=Pseudobacteriovorax antillogorgiicola TaxID=1513793 RepID=A0A1Y6BX61_9BACT|nr:phosphoribosylamine--glycine ligase [Pseudobacteriovorax antillogorgiicola]TCS50265.1 phosphoribosylamine--glycine ligase [Pseudobacteriovorax antillogorgiicola]SMF33353.1 phosphoribosylamine--glycine ligase [Pseudobacteriovorax antillogorgiicola]